MHPYTLHSLSYTLNDYTPQHFYVKLCMCYGGWCNEGSGAILCWLGLMWVGHSFNGRGQHSLPFLPVCLTALFLLLLLVISRAAITTTRIMMMTRNTPPTVATTYSHGFVRWVWRIGGVVGGVVVEVTGAAEVCETWRNVVCWSLSVIMMVVLWSGEQ